MAVFKVGPKNWGYRIYLGYDPKTKKRKTKTKKGFPTEKAARQAEAEARQKYGRIKDIDAGKVTFAQYMKEYLETYRKNRPSYETEKWYTDLYIIPHLGQYKLEEITADIIEKYYAFLLEQGSYTKKDKNGNPKGLSLGTVRRVHSILSRAFKVAYKKKKIAENPMHDIEHLAEPKPDPRGWDPEEAARFLAVAKERSPYYMIYRLGLAIGARPGELLALKWRNVNLRKGYIIIEEGLKKAGPNSKTGAVKTDSSYRTIYLPPDIIEELKEYKKKQEEMARKAEVKPWNPEGFVFVGRTGNPIHPENLRRNMRIICEAANVRYISPHGLRHTFATIALQENIHPKKVAEITGHASIETLIDMYSRYIPPSSQSVVSSVTQVIDQAMLQEASNDII